MIPDPTYSNPMLHYRRDARQKAGQVKFDTANADLAKRMKQRRSHERTVFKKYGMTPAAYQSMYRIQGGLCAICNDPHERLWVDHCHDTERVRGLLCNRCNSALGMIRENVTAARALVLYIERRCVPAKAAGPLRER